MNGRLRPGSVALRHNPASNVNNGEESAMKPLISAAAVAMMLMAGATAAEAHDRTYYRDGPVVGFGLFLGVPTYAPPPVVRYRYYAPPRVYYRGHWAPRHRWYRQDRRDWRWHDDHRGDRDGHRWKGRH
jgi:hypothetical protein